MFNVSIKGSCALALLLSTGGCQGSVLSPLLFSLYIFVLISSHNFYVYIYVDNTEIHLSSPEISLACLTFLLGWSTATWKLNTGQYCTPFSSTQPFLLLHTLLSVNNIPGYHNFDSSFILPIQSVARSCYVFPYDITKILPFHLVF